MMQLKPESVADPQQSHAFLKVAYPDGPWQLTSIEPDTRDIKTRTFTSHAYSAMYEWLKIQAEHKRNVYWSVNPSRGSLDKKAGKDDIEAVHWLHVDVDPHVGEDHAAERERIFALLTTKLPLSVPQPTVIIDSGGGYQAFWKLASPVALALGDTAGIEDIERYNKQLELIFGGDHCFNVDRIMRLPGSVNVPGEKKAKKGRVSAMARLVAHDPSRAYDLSHFKQAPRKEEHATTGTIGTTVTPLRPEFKLASIDELDQWPTIPGLDRVKIAIIHGQDAENPKPRDNSRSAWVFDVACQLARGGVPDHVIFSILMDKDFLISESVRGCGSNAERYALRQIARAKDEVEEPMLRELNDRHAVIESINGQTRVIEAEPGVDRPITKQSFNDFRNRYLNRTVQVGTNKAGLPVTQPAGTWWLAHPKRRQYHHMEFIPGDDAPMDVFNLWRGFTVQPIAGDCTPFLNFIREVICAGDQQHHEWLVRWMARAVQRPTEPGHVAVVLRGGQGIGKSFFAEQFGALFGRHFLCVTNERHVTGNFNAHLRETVLLFADESFVGSDRKHESVLKTLITGPTLIVEAKGVDPETAPNRTHIILASNERWVVAVAGDDRRVFALDVSDHRCEQHEWFRELDTFMKGGGRSALLHHLLTLDLSKWNHRAAPSSAAKDDLKNLSLRGAARCIYDLLYSGQPTQSCFQDGQLFVPTSSLLPADGSVTVKSMATELAKAAPPGAMANRACINGMQFRGYWLPPLGEARANFAASYGRDMPWPADDSRWVGAKELPP